MSKESSSRLHVKQKYVNTYVKNDIAKLTDITSSVADTMLSPHQTKNSNIWFEC